MNKGKWIGICGGVARNTNPGREAAAQNQHIHPAIQPTNNAKCFSHLNYVWFLT